MTSLRSGTVGAAAYAVASVLNGPVPAMAVGTDAPTCTPPATTCPEQESHFQVVADFIVRFVAHLQTKPGFLAREEGLLPTGVGLIVSYPKSDAIRGVKIAVQSEGALSPLLGVKVGGGIVCKEFSAGPLTPCSNLAEGESQTARMVLVPDPTPEVNNSDLDFFAQGYVTIVPFVPDITAHNPLVFKSILPGFAP
jgi:broad specificity polyphosphatase/5'/3'-nucleotidase SurE